MSDKAWLFAPSNKIRLDHLERAKRRLTKLHLIPLYSDSIIRTDLYFAGTLSRRKRELQSALLSSEGNILFAVRGGYASMEILDKLNWKKILRCKKTIVGYSDITAILMGFFTKGYSGTLIHAPNIGTSAWGKTSFEILEKCFRGEDYEVPLLKKCKYMNEADFQGRLLGGNLRIISHMFGTKYEIAPKKGDVLFFEDVQEESPAIYTMFLQLYLTGKLDNISALIIGQMNKSTKYLPLLKRFLKRIKVPVLYEVPLGHGAKMIPMRLGDTVRYDSKKKTLYFSTN